MRKSRVFRPSVAEILEARAVPSLAGVPLATGLPGISVTLPSQISPTNPQVQAAFTAFDASYTRAVDALLASPGAGGLVVPSSSLATFDAAIEQSLNTLAQQLVLSLNPGSTTTTTTTTTTGTATSGVAIQVVAAIVGGGSSSLEGQLLALPVATIEQEVPTASVVATTTPAGAAQALVGTIEQVRPTVRVPVAEAAGPSTTTGPASTASPSAGSTRAADAVRSAFNGFLNDYFGAVQGVLLAPTSAGQVAPAANRAAFDAKVGQSLQSLQVRLAAALAADPTTSALKPQVLTAIGGAGASSLKGQLANLATPQAAQASVVRDFTLGSTRAIARALALIGGDLAKAVAPAGP